MEDADYGDRLVVAIALQVERGEAKRRTESDDRGQGEQVRRLERPRPCPLPLRCYGATPPGGGGGVFGGYGAKEGKRPLWILLRNTPRLAGQFWIR